MLAFQAHVHAGTVPTKDNPEGIRDASWIPAKEIPANLLTEWLQLEADNKKHPHNIPGLGWDLQKGAWRNFKNASSSSTVTASVVFDLAAQELFKVEA